METFDQSPDYIPVKPDKNMPLAIIGTVIGCCSPCCIGFIVGIISLVFAGQVDSKYRIGDYRGAENSAKNARILAFVAIGLGILGIIINGIQVAMVGVDGIMEQYRDVLDQAGY